MAKWIVHWTPRLRGLRRNSDQVIQDIIEMRTNWRKPEVYSKPLFKKSTLVKWWGKFSWHTVLYLPMWKLPHHISPIFFAIKWQPPLNILIILLRLKMVIFLTLLFLLLLVCLFVCAVFLHTLKLFVFLKYFSYRKGRINA